MKVQLRVAFGLIAFSLIAQCLAEENYYDVLGISKDATTKEIRKAFKKIALKLHPDKNTGDPDAHSKFVRINNIYEVLKDEETREKYDKYGEEGLKEGFRGGGGRYESYSYYRDEFGIYDDDPEVVTLDGGDFEAAVNSGEPWFVNFYSPRCSHCHELAPTWRKFAEEMSGVINIGAVNCNDNYWICQNNGIYAYPSLVMFVRGQRPVKYQQDRTKKQLIKFVMKYVTVEVYDMWDRNYKQQLKKSNSDLPWVVSACVGNNQDDDEDDDDDGNCPSDIGVRKLAGLLNGIANVGSVTCDDSPKLCELSQLGSSGFHFFAVDHFPAPDEDFSPLEGGSDVIKTRHHFGSLDAREVREEFMRDFMPQIRRFSTDKLKAFVLSKPLLAFVKFDSETQDVDMQETQLKKLPAILKKDKISVCKVLCDEWCREKLHINQDATLLFRGTGIRDFEVFHGRMKTSEITAFAVESANARIVTLNPTDFEGRKMKDEKSAWFVDFFAPWCPPCKAFLPELRKVSTRHPRINFGTVDCVMHERVCAAFGIHSYPTSVILNGTKLTEYHGHLEESSVSLFIQETITPPYEELNGDKFDDMVHDRVPGVTWVVYFYKHSCPPCRHTMPEFKKTARMLNGIVKFGAIDCEGEESSYCRRQQVSSFPELRVYPSKKRPNSKPLYSPFQGHQRSSRRIIGWIMENLPNVVKTMTSSDYGSDGALLSEDAWVIDFYASWCGPCHAFMPKFLITAAKFADNKRVKFGKIDCQQHSTICSRAGIRAYPSVVFFPPGDARTKQTQKREIDSQEPDQIAQIVERLMQGYPEKQKKRKTEL